jgi:hypothetical protein
MSDCPFHKMLRKLTVFAGLPVPITAKWVDGKPDFRQTDEEQLLKSVRFKLCAVCGAKLGLTCYWVGGQLCEKNHYFTDPGMHRECAEESIKLCPFLNGRRTEYRGSLPSQGIHDTSKRPDRMFLMRGLTSAMEWRRLGVNSTAIYAGDNLTTIGEF